MKLTPARAMDVATLAELLHAAADRYMEEVLPR
jgi:hypothetical protein